jgi:hypothetical protein
MIKIYEINETSTVLKAEKYGDWNLGGDANISVGYTFGSLREIINTQISRRDEQPLTSWIYLKPRFNDIYLDYNNSIKSIDQNPKYYLNLWLADTKRTRNLDYNLQVFRMLDQTWSKGDGNWDYHVLKNDDWGTNYSYSKIEIEQTWNHIVDNYPPGIASGSTFVTASLHNAWSINDDQFKNRYRYPDFKVELTDWVRSGFDNIESGSIGDMRNGLAIQLNSDLFPSGSTDWGVLNFYSCNTDTPFLPFISCEWSSSQTDYDSYLSGSLTEITLNNDIMLEVVEPREWWDINENAKIYINARSPWNVLNWDVPTYTSGSRDLYKLTDYYLPEESYYQVHLSSTYDIILPWGDATKVARDERGSYINMDMSNFHSYLIYQIQIVSFDENSNRFVFNVNNGNFKVR